MNDAWNSRLRAVCSFYLYPWAALVIRRRRPTVIGVTGSVGKTSAKEFIAAALTTPEAKARLGLAWKTYENMNSNFGIPLTVLGFRAWPFSNMQVVRWMLIAPFKAIAFATFAKYPRVLVLEYAAGWGCDVPRNARLVRPDVAVVTAVGPAHLERYGTLSRIVEEKAGLVTNVKATGIAIVGSDNDHAQEIAGFAKVPVVMVPGRGRALAENIARVVSEHFGLDRVATERAIAGYPGYRDRLQVLALRDITVINDCYNASPLSMKLALDTLGSLAGPTQRKVAILGTMAELGADAADYHREIAVYAAERASIIVGVGELARHYQGAHWYATSAECASVIDSIVRADDCVLVKGSNSVNLKLVIERLKTLSPTAGEPQRSPTPAA